MFKKILPRLCLCGVLMTLLSPGLSARVNAVSALIDAVNNGPENDTVLIGPGTYKLSAPLQPQKGMTLKGAGTEATIIIADDDWNPGTDDLPDKGLNHKSVNRQAYLIDLADKTTGVTISDMTLKAPRLHGLIYGNDCDELELFNLRLEDCLWSGIRTFRMNHARIHDNVFINAGGKVRHNGGALYMTWVADSEFWNNRIYRTAGENFYGFKGRQGRRCRFHHNTVEVNFSFEFPFELDDHIEIDHNAFAGVISIPKHGGGNVIEDGYAFHIHHNWLKTSYALEWARNSTIVENNLFDFDTQKDGGNLISNFGAADCPGPTWFRNNLISNPGRGIFWSRGKYNRFYFTHNHIITRTTATPRREGLFGLPKDTDFNTIEIKNNIIECRGLPRPLMRNDESRTAVIENNTLINVSDSNACPNPETTRPRGLILPLDFACGVNGEYRVKGWEVKKRSPDKSEAHTNHLWINR